MNPWGPERGDLQAAIMPYTFANAFAGKGQKPKFKDYVLHFGEKVKQVGSRIWAAMEGARMYQNSIHGKDKNAKNG